MEQLHESCVVEQLKAVKRKCKVPCRTAYVFLGKCNTQSMNISLAQSAHPAGVLWQMS